MEHRQPRVNHSVAQLLAELGSDAPPVKKRAKKAVECAAAVEEEEADEEEWYDAEEEAREDPYAVRDARFHAVSAEEYNESCRVALHPSISFDFQRFERVSRHAYWNARVAQPERHYAHDPLVLLDALTLATHLEDAARRAATQVPYERLVVTENNDTQRVLDAISADPDMRQAIKGAGEEFLWALMAVEHATRHPPDALAERLK